jgi:hypothetical protein
MKLSAPAGGVVAASHAPARIGKILAPASPRHSHRRLARCGELHPVAPGDEASRLHDAGGAQRLLGQQQARAQNDAVRHPVGLVLMSALTSTSMEPSFTRCPRADAEAAHQQRIGHAPGMPSFVASDRRASCRLRASPAIERIIAVDRLGLDQRAFSPATAMARTVATLLTSPFEEMNFNSSGVASRWTSENSSRRPRAAVPAHRARARSRR